MQYFIGIYLKRLFYYTAINRARSTKKRETGLETKNETENRICLALLVSSLSKPQT